MPAQAEWDWSDAWVLAAITMSGADHDASLADVIRAADAVNHAIPTEDELQRAVARLLGAGLISAAQRRFRRTEAGRNLVAGRRGGMMGQVDHLLTKLRRLPVRALDWHLEPGELRKAVEAWQRTAARIQRG